MDVRAMPTGTFRCAVSGDQEGPVTLTYHRRKVGAPDVARPTPKCPNKDCPSHRQPMELLQVDYQGEAA